ncbi:hypothetical protein [Leptospira levettii]|nr:hypothetical protein [Leptospira levettii]MCW7475587.1 hypothetical protein [Leptospira levettii]
MKSIPIKIFTFLILFILNCQNGENKMNIEWPNLSNYKAISGRIATEKDIDDGIAVFSLKLDGKYVGKPMDIDIPQYAIHIDNETKEETPCVVIQAEISELDELIGCVNIKDNSHLVGMKNEFNLLGTKRPK